MTGIQPARRTRATADRRRRFTDRQVRQLLIAADSKCQRCGADLNSEAFEAHHIRRHADGGRTQLYNGMVLCVPCHKEITCHLTHEDGSNNALNE